MKRLVAVLMAVCMLGAVPVRAEEMDKEARIAELEKQIAELQAELSELKGEAAEGSVLYEDDQVIIKYAGITGEGTDYKIELELENISEKNLLIQLRETSLNGYMVDLLMNTKLAPGKKAKDSFGFASWDKEAAAEYPLEELESIETAFWVCNSDDWSDSYKTDQVVIK